MSKFTGFTPALFEFYQELEVHNDRAWWQANKGRYEQVVRGPALAFIEAMAPRIATISPHLLAVPRKVGGSMMRPQRDTRFGKDKRPYKLNVGIQFRHERGKDVHAPGLYVHLSADELFAGAGVYHPEPKALKGLREAIVSQQQRWTGICAGAAERGWRQGGESLKRAPRGYPLDHPMIVELRRKDHVIMRDLGVGDVLGPDSVEVIGDLFDQCRDYMAFLAEGLGLEF